ncbi:MAG TPA: hypothetical protein PKV98_02620 [Burkholderiaceae bacterium]|nr:hypothetical protein [Burkholderiaceae bacterium]
MVTLFGMGGLGKTRLCLQVAAESMHRFPDGVWFLDLVPLRDEALVVAEATKEIGVQPEPDRTPLQSLCAHLRARRALLVVDNCEHLVKASAELCNAVMRAAPHVRVLATSREALRVPGEQSYPLHPLPLPATNAGVDELSQSSAVRLFVERARQGRPSFVLDATQAPAVSELVARLEGIPLALELAAARMRVLSVADINARLKDRFKLLVGGGRVLQERQQTLRALVDWSYDLLSETERLLLGRLSVFVGGFDLQSAEAICGADPLPPEDILDLLASLVDKSLVMLDESDERARYRMLETIRDYAREKLEASGEMAVIAARHCEHFFGLSKQARDGITGPEQAEWSRRLETDLDNVRAAMTFALGGAADRFVPVKFAVALERFWELRGYATEGRAYMKAVLKLPDVQNSDVAHAWALYVSAQLAESQSDFAEDRRLLERCLELRRRLDNPVDIAATLSTLSTARLHMGDVAGAKECELEALGIFRKAEDRQGEAIGLFHLGQIAAHLSNDEEAHSLVGQALSIAREIKYQELETVCDLASGELSFEAADFARAVSWFARGYTVARDAADKRGEANALRWLGASDLQAGNLSSARNRLTEAMQALRKLEMWDELLGCLEEYAELLNAEGDLTLAVRITAAAANARLRLGLVRSPRAEQRLRSRIARYRERATGFDDDWNLGEGWSVDDAIVNALKPETVSTPAAPRETAVQATQ